MVYIIFDGSVNPKLENKENYITKKHNLIISSNKLRLFSLLFEFCTCFALIYWFIDLLHKTQLSPLRFRGHRILPSKAVKWKINLQWKIHHFFNLQHSNDFYLHQRFLKHKLKRDKLRKIAKNITETYIMILLSKLFPPPYS